MARPVRTKKRPSYRGARYWEKEKPVEARTESVILTYFAKAGKLQVSLLWSDPETGEKHRGKTVTFDMEDFQLHPEAGELLKRVLTAWQ